MTKLIIYIDSEQKTSAYRIEEENSYLISFNGNEYESDLENFATTVMEELRAKPLSKLESRGGISVLIVSNGATNETIRKIMVLLFHDDKENGILNVNIQELNVIEAKYFLPLIGNPEAPSAKDFESIYSIANSSVQQKELDDLKSHNSQLMKEIEEYKENLDKINTELIELRKIKNEVISRKTAQEKEEKLSESIYKIDFAKDAENSGVTFEFHKKFNSGKTVSVGETIASYSLNSLNYLSMINRNNEISITAKKGGKLYYMVDNNSSIKNGEVIAVIGEKTWTEDDARHFLKQIQNSDNEKKNENEPVIIKADVIRNYVSETSSFPTVFCYHPIKDLENGKAVVKNQCIMQIITAEGNNSWDVRAPLDGQVFFLVQTKGDYNSTIESEKSLALIVPMTWSKSQAVEWYRSVEPLKEPKKLHSVGDRYLTNRFPNGAWVLPDDKYVKSRREEGIFDKYYTEIHMEGFCEIAGRIEYKKCKEENNSYYSSWGQIIAEIY